ncbi:MAG TPA: phosphoribosylanthranilate isomerase, partial [Acidobacteriaceae bacterium]|nr:phosphoribosylanthranilate isomerase [Acidobacteriaceae bacterium]
MWIKVCANTSLEDALLAAEAGANAVGFVFAESVRRVTPAQVRAITPHLPESVEKIGVFVNASQNDLIAAIQDCGLTGVQLHSGCEPGAAARLR